MWFLGVIVYISISFFTICALNLLDSESYVASFICAAGGVLFTVIACFGCYEQGKIDTLSNKVCPKCYEIYSQSDSFCLHDGAELKLIIPQEKK